MSDPSPLWPAKLHHIEITTPDIPRMAGFYETACGYRRQELAGGFTLLDAGERRLLLSSGAPRGLGMAAFALESRAQLDALRGYLHERGVAPQSAHTPLFQEGAIAVSDPDQRTLAFGLPNGVAADGPAGEALPGRLQHVVVTTLELEANRNFYENVLGFTLSDRVLREDTGEATTYFYRSDPEHHTFAVFLSDSVRLDHHALDVPDWNGIRDWSDHFSEARIPILWGPGRHGPGNNLFAMVADPDGNMVEVSAELEHMPRDMPARDWPHNERSLNLWGPAIMRS